MKFLLAFLAGLTFAILLGSTAEEGVWSRQLHQPGKRTGIYTSTFSGITSEGACYLAVTNTINGQTEVIGIPQDVLADITVTPLQATEQGTSIIKLSR
jgi:hypothetical protein